MAKKKERWIQEAIKRPGALKAKAARAGALKKDGTIKESWLEEKAKGNDLTAKQARLALTLKDLSKRKKKKS